jgi:Reverse transcriptase (RNA-dependent DNA polymerase)
MKKKIIAKNNWITTGIKISSKKLKDLYILKSSGALNPVYYRKYKTIYRKVVRHAKKMYFDNIMKNSSNISKTAWNIIGSNIKNSPKSDNFEIDVENIIITDNRQVSNEFNSYFTELPKTLQNQLNYTNINSPKSNKRTEKTIFLTPTNKSEVINIIKNLKLTNSVGPDDISVRIIKECSEHYTEPLVHIINESFKTGIYPDLLKISKIIPLYKKGDKTKTSNYRPIAILSVFSKIFEKIIAKRLLNFLESENVLSKNQFGFQNRKSTQSALLRILKYVYDNLDRHNKVIALFVDLTKAFDCVDHEILLSTIENFGIRGVCNDLLRSYLQNRHQFVECFNERSSLLPIEIGVPQGSVLGPLLFILYLNDLDSNLDIFHAAFADDITVISSTTDFLETSEQLKINFNKLLIFFESKKLIFNQEKTFIMQFYTSPAQYDRSLLLRHTDKLIKQITDIKLLGLHIDLGLTWKTHVSAVCTKCSKMCYPLKRLRQITSINTIKTYYFSCFESQLRYGIIFWGNSSSSIRVFRLQKRAIRYMFNLKYRETCRPVFINNRILTFPSLFIFEILKFVKLNIEEFTRQDAFHNYSTRHGGNLQHASHRLSLFESNPYYIGTILYNKLPTDIKNLPTANQYLRAIKNLLVSKAFYSVDEFLNPVDILN